MGDTIEAIVGAVFSRSSSGYSKSLSPLMPKRPGTQSKAKSEKRIGVFYR